MQTAKPVPSRLATATLADSVEAMLQARDLLRLTRHTHYLSRGDRAEIAAVVTTLMDALAAPCSRVPASASGALVRLHTYSRDPREETWQAAWNALACFALDSY